MAVVVTRTIILAMAVSMLAWPGCCLPTSRRPCERQEVARNRTTPTVVSADGRQVATCKWTAEGVAETTIRRRGGSAAADTVTLRHAVPICWSPADENVILVRTACASNDEHLVTLTLDGRREYDLGTLDADEAIIIGSPFARFVKWDINDTITYEDQRSDERMTEFQVADASKDAVILQERRVAVGGATFEIQIVTSPSRARYCFVYVYYVEGDRREAVWTLSNPVVESFEAEFWTAAPISASDSVVPVEALHAAFQMESCLLVARGFTGGAACCNIVSVVGLLADGTVSPLLVNSDLGRCSLVPYIGQYANGAPRLGLVACDYLFEGLFGMGYGAESPRPRVLLQIVSVDGDQKWEIQFCPELQREYYARSADAWPRNNLKNKAECDGFTGWKDGWIPSGLVKTTADLVYGGRGCEVDDMLDEVWPAREPGKLEYRRKFAAIVRRSQWYGELRTMNPDCSWLVERSRH